MSVKHRVKDRLSNNTINPKYNKPHSWGTKFKYQHHIYSSCPRWYNKLFHIRPLRRANHYLCYKLQHDLSIADGLYYPLSHKPLNYFW